MQADDCHAAYYLTVRYDDRRNGTNVAHIAVVNGSCRKFRVSRVYFLFHLNNGVFFSSGKTTFLTNLLLQWATLYPDRPLRKICLIYSYEQPDYERLRQSFGDIFCSAKTLSEKVLSTDTLGVPSSEHPAMLIIDDSAWRLTNSPELTSLFCGACHHLK